MNTIMNYEIKKKIKFSSVLSELCAYFVFFSELDDAFYFLFQSGGVDFIPFNSMKDLLSEGHRMSKNLGIKCSLAGIW